MKRYRITVNGWVFDVLVEPLPADAGPAGAPAAAPAAPWVPVPAPWMAPGPWAAGPWLPGTWMAGHGGVVAVPPGGAGYGAPAPGAAHPGPWPQSADPGAGGQGPTGPRGGEGPAGGTGGPRPGLDRNPNRGRLTDAPGPAARAGRDSHPEKLTGRPDGQGGAGEGRGTPVRAPLPGVLVDVKVQPGQRVEAGTVIAILEAMKMENEIAAPCAGRVTSVPCRRGEALNQGDVVAWIDADPGS